MRRKRLPKWRSIEDKRENRFRKPEYNDNCMETPAIRVVNVFIENDEYIMLCVVVGIN